MYLRLLAVMLALLLHPVAAQCNTLQVEGIGEMTVTQGTLAIFPIAIKNNAAAAQNIYLSATNNYLGEVSAYFDESFYTLAPQETKSFNFFVLAAPGNYDFPLEVRADYGAGSCTENLLLHLTVEGAAPSPTPGAGISVSMTPSSPLQKFPGEKASYDIIMRNDLSEEIVVSIDSPSNPFDSGTSLSESEFRVGKGATKAIKATIILPPGTPQDDYEVVFRLQATSACCVQEFILPAAIRVNSKTADLRLINPPLECISVKHGEKKQLELGVRNDGEIQGPFTLRLSGNDDEILPVRLPLKQFELSTGERDYFNLTISPTSMMPLSIYYFTLEARYLDFLLFQKEFCYEVGGLSTVAIEKPSQASVTRCETNSFTFKVRNVGTLADEYAIEAKPLVGAKPYLEPEVFSLTPGEMQIVNYIVQTSCSTPLGTQLASVIVRPRDASALSVTMPFEVLASGTSSPLEIEAAAKISGVAGEQQKIIVNLFNAAQTEMADTQLSVTGVPSGWAKIVTPKTTIKPGRAAPFIILLEPAASGTYKLKFTANSGSELSVLESDLIIQDAKRQIVYAYEISPLKEGEFTTSAVITLTIRNTGNTKLSGIDAKIDDPKLNAVPLDTIGDLGPGESQTYRLQVRPLADILKKDVTLRIFTDEGATFGDTIELPAMQVEIPQLPDEFPWKLIVIALLVIFLLWLLSRQTI
ncbi:MAG: hypothetical protein ABH863_03105 [Candidatus Micrarchaeota archaeon]